MLLFSSYHSRWSLGLAHDYFGVWFQFSCLGLLFKQHGPHAGLLKNRKKHNFNFFNRGCKHRQNICPSKEAILYVKQPCIHILFRLLFPLFMLIRYFNSKAKKSFKENASVLVGSLKTNHTFLKKSRTANSSWKIEATLNDFQNIRFTSFTIG